jgi:hypothetical protein
MDAKKNAYWIAMGALVLGALVFWVMTVSALAGGQNKRIEEATKKLNTAVGELQKFAKIPDDKVADPSEGMPVPKIVENWEKHKQDLEKDRAEIEKLYRARQAAFEMMPVGTRDPDGSIRFSDWITKFHTQVTELKKYGDLLEGGAAPDNLFPAAKDPQEGQDFQIVIWQKHMYMVHAIADAAREAGAHAVTEITFKDIPTPDAKAEKKSMILRIGATATVEMKFPDVSKLASRLLRAGVLFDVRDIHVEATTFTLPKFEPFKVFPAVAPLPGQSAQPGMKNFIQDVYLGTIDLANPKVKGIEPPQLEEPPVAVHVALDALDFTFPPEEKAKQ